MDRRQKEIAHFLRSRRARLKPRDAGLRSGMRRRTPGLRREEVAELAGIGAGWYTFLEQGRDVRPSEGTLRRIAKALRLDPTEEGYLLNLALEPPPPPRGQAVTPADLAGVIQTIMSPALVLGPGWDFLSYNEALDALLDLPYCPYRNVLQLAFSPEYRVFNSNWEQRARHLVHVFRAQNAASLGDPRVGVVVEDLEKRSPQFREWWADLGLAEETSGRWAYDHPFVGSLQFCSVMLGVLDIPGIKLNICTCDGEESQRRLDELIRQLRHGEHGPAHNLWTALGAMLEGHVRSECPARV
jgi:transcriptional regulator with XRE-family HTH domain